MCNCRGWDVASDGSDYWIEQHFCRVYEDCGHSDNTYESAVQVVIEGYDRNIDYQYSSASWNFRSVDELEVARLKEQRQLWKDGTHPYYLKEENDG